MGGSMRVRFVVSLIAVAAAVATVAAPSGAVVPQPYGTNDAGGFRNVLPPGENGLDTAGDIAAFQSSGEYPPHWIDQQILYNDLIYAAPTLTNAQVKDYYKDATFGVKAGQV